MTKVLIVDDEEAARLMLAEILRLEGYDIAAVSNGEAALESLRREVYDVMVLDLKMVGMSGMEVMRKAIDITPDLSVIVITAHSTMDTAIQAIHYQVHDYLLKPVHPEQVLESIDRAMAKKGSSKRRIEERSLAAVPSRVENLPGGAFLSWDKRQISWEGGRLSLTPTESRLLKVLFERKNEVVSHSDLVYMIQGYRIETEEAAKILRPVVSRLRQKLSAVPDWDDRIRNIRGAGYVLELE